LLYHVYAVVYVATSTNCVLSCIVVMYDCITVHGVPIVHCSVACPACCVAYTLMGVTDMNFELLATQTHLIQLASQYTVELSREKSYLRLCLSLSWTPY